MAWRLRSWRGDFMLGSSAASLWSGSSGAAPWGSGVAQRGEAYRGLAEPGRAGDSSGAPGPSLGSPPSPWSSASPMFCGAGAMPQPLGAPRGTSLGGGGHTSLAPSA